MKCERIFINGAKHKKKIRYERRRRKSDSDPTWDGSKISQNLHKSDIDDFTELCGGGFSDVAD